jgi:hypothetical protein
VDSQTGTQRHMLPQSYPTARRAPLLSAVMPERSDPWRTDGVGQHSLQAKAHWTSWSCGTEALVFQLVLGGEPLYSATIPVYQVTRDEDTKIQQRICPGSNPAEMRLDLAYIGSSALMAACRRQAGSHR